MTDLEQTLTDHGFTADDVTLIVDLIEQRDGDAVLNQAAHFLHLVFLRVERDSAAGCALRRALGFSSELSLERAAAAFCVKKQYLHTLQAELEDKLGELSFLAKQARATPPTPPPGPSKT